MNFSMRFIFEALLRTLRLVGLQACEQALSNKRDGLFLKSPDTKTPPANPEQDNKG
ncbi:hypothetical protein HBA92_09670 [Ochrobactrum sp. MR28]|jgi:hypothetical protein|uniref:hypothetical protein n=1 Tax=Pseudochrobactrum asaccharolyticum TaxID=354351 RepID=UPI0040423C53|nr:hypothetical protein [Ochrobactrum sp. MR28]MBX8815962.1 hypothetical protein [Ochrobactrum sp. MR31]